MFADADTFAMHQRLVETLYCDTMVLADEARDYGEHRARGDAAALDPAASVVFSCESLRLTTRLMHLLGWLLNHRAIAAGELCASGTSTRLVGVAPTDAALRAKLPIQAAILIEASEALYRRAAILDAAFVAAPPSISPARALQQRLAIDLRG
ncbi:DUF1465 family protein [Sphingomonas sp. KR1UV-12]|uniref:DUF1465 family protein n=1 Tax=Sphingomonas aurea TaxID=3063994 RepID=A0ABT9EH11_9SPHN|nr:DUF1465 family protein [Sphingomonas sp. KR1UV-12]MDP1026260.1 DUF1465 family protein [Sphingomonas sp. KR1UV-12]